MYSCFVRNDEIKMWNKKYDDMEYYARLGIYLTGVKIEGN